MRDLDPMIMGLADRNQDLSQRSQLTPSPILIINRLLYRLCTAQHNSIRRLMLFFFSSSH